MHLESVFISLTLLLYLYLFLWAGAAPEPLRSFPLNRELFNPFISTPYFQKIRINFIVFILSIFPISPKTPQVFTIFPLVSRRFSTKSCKIYVAKQPVFISPCHLILQSTIIKKTDLNQRIQVRGDKLFFMANIHAKYQPVPPLLPAVLLSSQGVLFVAA